LAALGRRIRRELFSCAAERAMRPVLVDRRIRPALAALLALLAAVVVAPRR
jgi:hypothetical protein